MEEVTKRDISLSTWDWPYPKNIPVKYVEVAATSNVNQDKSYFFFDSLLKSIIPASKWVITGPSSMTAGI